MNICFIGPASSSHIVKWCNWFSKNGHNVHVISFVPGCIESADVHIINTKVKTDSRDLKKVKYLFTGRKIRQLVNNIQPDIINVHYASSYGVATALSGVKNYILSIWGSDVYDFPQKSYIHKLLLKYSLKKAKILFSTSKSMAKEARKYTKKQFEITPFGVDLDLFNPAKRSRLKDGRLIVGTVKTLSEIYGIDVLLEAIAIVKSVETNANILLRISGDGPQMSALKEKAKILGIDEITTFLGRISQIDAAKEWANMDIAVVPSVMYESFGVAAVEAEASGVPIIISDVDGLLETTNPGVSSIVTHRKDADSVAKAIMELYHDEKRRELMGKAGREYAQQNYELNDCFKAIERLYEENCRHSRGKQ